MKSCLLVAFKEGVGLNKNSITILNNQEYDRNVVYHTKEELNNSSNKYFEFVEDLTTDFKEKWRYYIYRRK